LSIAPSEPEPVVQIRPHASAFAGIEQLSQSAVPKAFDHTAG